MRKGNPVLYITTGIIILVLSGFLAVHMLGILGMGTKRSFTAQVTSTSEVAGKYIVQTAQGTLEVDFLGREGVENPTGLFNSIKSGEVYNFIVVGEQRVLLGNIFYPYVVKAELLPSTLPPRFRQRLKLCGFENIFNTDLWVHWSSKTLISIEANTYVILVGPAPTLPDP